jgi:hypothetical protein
MQWDRREAGEKGVCAAEESGLYLVAAGLIGEFKAAYVAAASKRYTWEVKGPGKRWLECPNGRWGCRGESARSGSVSLWLYFKDATYSMELSGSRQLVFEDFYVYTP